MKKLLLTLAVTVACGAAAGVGVAHWRLSRAPWEGPLPSATHRSTPLTLPDAPRVEIETTEYEFGTLSLGAKGQRRFVFRNVGRGPLQLTAGDTSCKCTLSEVGDGTIAPGDETRVLVTWKGEGSSGPYRQTATILTNDPLRPRVVLTVSGRITVAARPHPAELTFTHVSAEEPTTGRVDLYGYLQEPLEVTKTELFDAATAAHFAVECRPLTAEELQEERDAKSGVAVSVTVKPGLPQGPFQQTIRLATSYPSVPTFEIPVRGTVTSEIAVAGRGWDNERDVLVLGTIDRGQGAERRLLLVVRGPHRRDVTFRPVEVVPDVLEVSVGETKAINNDVVFQTPLVIKIPKGSRPCSYLGPDNAGYGRIVLETTHPKVKKLNILVCFAVED